MIQRRNVPFTFRCAIFFRRRKFHRLRDGTPYVLQKYGNSISSTELLTLGGCQRYICQRRFRKKVECACLISRAGSKELLPYFQTSRSAAPAPAFVRKKKEKKPWASGRTFDKGEVERETTESRRTKLDSRGKRRWSRVDYLSRQRNGKVLSRRLCVAGQKTRQEKADCLRRRERRREKGDDPTGNKERKKWRESFLGLSSEHCRHSCAKTAMTRPLAPISPLCPRLVSSSTLETSMVRDRFSWSSTSFG